MKRRLKNNIIKSGIAFLLLTTILLVPAWKKGHKRTGLYSAPLPDTLTCSVLLDNSLYAEGYSTGYLYELFHHFNGYQHTKVIISPEDNTPDQWTRLEEGSTDMLIINAKKDTIPESFRDRFISGIPLNPEEDIYVVRKDNYRLLHVLNFWFNFFKQTPEYARLLQKYTRNYRIPDNFSAALSREAISPYDKYIKEYSESLGWNWKLLASLIYQESKFKVGVSSDKGAVGLMQIKESVAQKYGVENIYDPRHNIRAGVFQLKHLQNMYRKMGADSLDLIKLTLASYNCGEGRMEDCMELARQEGKNPLLWDDLASVIPLLQEEEYYTREGIKQGKFQGKETLRFVDNIMERYEKYKEVVKP